MFGLLGELSNLLDGARTDPEPDGRVGSLSLDSLLPIPYGAAWASATVSGFDIKRGLLEVSCQRPERSMELRNSNADIMSLLKVRVE
jgi:hypothetical protein